MAIEFPKNTAPAVNFVLQVIIGATMFVVVLLVAYLIAAFVTLLAQSGAPRWMIAGAQWVEWLLFWLDIFVFGLFLVSETLTFVMELFREQKRRWAN